MSSRLFTEVREKRGLCYTRVCFVPLVHRQRCSLVLCGTTNERAQETLDVVIDELRKTGCGIEEAELTTIESPDSQRNGHAAGVLPRSRAGSIAGDWFHLGTVRTLDEINAENQGFTVESINEYLAAHPPQQF